MADILNTDDYKLDYTSAKAGMEGNGKEFSNPNDPFINQDSKSELESFYAVRAETFRFFKGIDGQIISVLNTPIINLNSIEQFRKQVNSLLPTLAKLKLSIRMFNIDTLSKAYETKINQIIAYIQNEMIIDDVEIVSCQLFDLLEKNEQAFANEQLEVKRQQAEEQERKAREKIFEIEMVFVEGGTFTMGATPEQDGDCFDNEKPAHQVTLSSFSIGKYPVTQAQWEAVMGNNTSINKGDCLPVDHISWGDVQKFFIHLYMVTGKKYRLPTEAEWEYAARGGKKSKGYKYSGSDNLNDVAWYYVNSGVSQPVGTKKPNELGIYDMSGNVWEWCQDIYGEYSSHSQNNPQGPSSGDGSYRVIRGGYCNNLQTQCFRVSYRSSQQQGSSYYCGFRVALSL